MKKIFYLILFFIIFADLFLHAKVSDNVQSSIKLIVDAQKQVEEVRSIIQGTANKLKTKLIGGINKNINSSIVPAIKTIENSEQKVEKIPNIVLAVVNIGDLKKTLAEMKGLVNKVKGFLEEDVKAVFQKHVDAFDRAKDSRGIHGLLDGSKAKFKDAKAGLVELKGYLVDLGM